MAGSGLLAKGAPPQPIWLTYMRYAILGLSLVILAIAAYGVAILGGGCYLGYCYSGAGGLVIFVVRVLSSKLTVRSLTRRLAVHP